MDKFNDLISLDRYIKHNKDDIFADLIAERNQINYLKSLIDMPLDQLEEKVYGEKNYELPEDRMPLCDLLQSKLGSEIEKDAELKEVVQCETYIWELSAKKVASLFNRIGLDVKTAEEKIKSQFIFSSRSNTVMARSHASTSIQEMEDSLTVFQIKKEENKRDQFLKALKEELNKA
ncbi:hypothetical protein [Paenibacillus chitinolyticus]|uniref:hypothetical protein n=1 Tax=Paenibacillus chitinolyticus TaxID=79263 RepID=UPI001C492684|nr:hypothetical protein [Paenibacillus chitinolyticus]MBV6717274.1 hypothetical protein [Paenibacillus chitinolyticus]